MKKFTTFLIAGFATISAFAQISAPAIPSVEKNPGLKATELSKFNKKTNRRTDYGSWYTYTDAYKEGVLLGQEYSTFVRWVMPDTNAGFVYTDGNYASIGIHVVGSMFDPKDSLFQSTGQEVLTKFNPYTVDTIAWTEYYVRNLDSIDVGGVMTEVIDTVVVEYFDFTGIQFRGFTFNNMNHINGSPKTSTYQKGSLRNTSAIKTDYILLGTKDRDSLDRANGRLFGSVGYVVPGIKSMSTSAGTDVRINTTCFSLAFKPMVRAKLGDTIVNWNNVPTTTKVNTYGVRMAYIENNFWEITSPFRVNNAFWTNSQLLFGATVNGWSSYLPTTAYNTGYFLPYDIHISTQNLKATEIQPIQNLAVYPNPANIGNNFHVTFNSASVTSGKVEIMDLNGKVIVAGESRNFANGSNTVTVNATLTAGIYMVAVKTANGTQSTKLIVQ
ncbi:MAG: T9SS type A sorting domain-containing protein [Bacteroidota bacterium]|jgi:hypothetical protein